MSDHRESRVLVVGDVMLDLYTWGTAERVSPEAPVLVLKAEREEARLGGAGAVAALLAALDVQPALAGVVGDDPAGRVVSRLVAKLGRGANSEFGTRNSELPIPNSELPIPNFQAPLLSSPDRPTTVKERLLGQTAGRHGQQMLRVDHESCRPLPPEIEEKIRRSALAALQHVQAVLISDYGKGVCTPKLMSSLIRAARKRNLPVLVDPRRGGDYKLYRWATLIKPNRHEAGQATGRDIHCLAEAFAAGKELCARWGFRAVVITLDADGLVLVTADGASEHYVTRDREVADVTGAGDTVLAVLGLALARGMALIEACRLANIAAALQVERLGVAPINWKEVEASSREQKESEVRSQKPEEGDRDSEFVVPSVPPPLCPSVPKLFPVPCTLFPTLASHRARGQRIVFTNGCFDLLHAGHVHCLTAAKALGDVLVVAVNSNASVRRLKGPSRPIVGQRYRAAMLAALACVDYVTIFDDDTPERLISEIRPDVLVKGAEPRPGEIPGESIVASCGGRVELVELLPGVSTTRLIKQSSKFRVQSSKF